ncbi:MAG: CpaF family protein [archaeon]|nr:MAG: CpaF family protein [archaeon]
MKKRKIKSRTKKKKVKKRKKSFHALSVPKPTWKKPIKETHDKLGFPSKTVEIKKVGSVVTTPQTEKDKKLGLPTKTDKEEIQEIKTKIKERIQVHGKIIKTYDIDSNNVKVKISILDTEKGLFYQIKIPEISRPTRALLENIKQKLIGTIEMGASEITDINAIEKLKQKLISRSKDLLQRFKSSRDNITLLTSILINEMLGLGNIELLVADPHLEEIVIASAQEPVRVYHKEFGWLPTNIYLENEKQTENYSAIIARRVGRQITTLTPMLDAHLVTGDRVNAVLYPICTRGNTITIRKFAREPWTIVDFINNKTCSADVFAMIWMAIQYEMNILFSGGTASGKTTMLNVCTPFFPANHRILSIEDTRELQLPEHLYWSPLTTRLPNPEGKGAVTMLDLLVNSLRMRPDRIILGEVRKHETAEVLFEAMHTGHSVYSTVHANTSSETVARLVNPPISIPPNLLKAVDLNVVMFRERRRGIRRVFQLTELIPDETDKNGVKPNILYRWEPSSDKIISHASTLRFFEDMSRHTGMSFSQINKDLKEKKEFIEHLVKNNIREMNSIGKMIQDFYLKKGIKDIKTKKPSKIKKIKKKKRKKR